MIFVSRSYFGLVRFPPQTEPATVIPPSLAASHVGEYITWKALFAKIFLPASPETLSHIGAACPNQIFRLDTARITVSKLSYCGHRREARDQHPSDREQRAKDRVGNSLANSCSCRWVGFHLSSKGPLDRTSE